MLALIDGDILRYEIGFGAETGWKAITESEDLPPWEYVAEMLHNRIASIVQETGADSYQIFITEGQDTFRYRLATEKPYKGTRKDKKPFHFNNLTMYMTDVMKVTVVRDIEADDALAIKHMHPKSDTILCSRDKDLRQVPGKFFSWELGKQPSFGPTEITEAGSLKLDEIAKPKKLTGTGFPFFCSQVLTGDAVDNIPGLPKCGPVAAYNLLHDHVGDPEQLLIALEMAYEEVFPDCWEEKLLEQGRLCWVVRNLRKGEPVMWELGMYQ